MIIVSHEPFPQASARFFFLFLCFFDPISPDSILWGHTELFYCFFFVAALQILEVNKIKAFFLTQANYSYGPSSLRIFTFSALPFTNKEGEYPHLGTMYSSCHPLVQIPRRITSQQFYAAQGFKFSHKNYLIGSPL